MCSTLLSAVHCCAVASIPYDLMRFPRKWTIVTINFCSFFDNNCVWIRNWLSIRNMQPHASWTDYLKLEHIYLRLFPLISWGVATSQVSMHWQPIENDASLPVGQTIVRWGNVWSIRHGFVHYALWIPVLIFDANLLQRIITANSRLLVKQIWVQIWLRDRQLTQRSSGQPAE